MMPSRPAMARVMGLALVVAATAASPAQNFEGILTYTVTSHHTTSDVKYYSKGDRMRVEVSGTDDAGMIMLMDGNSTTMVMLIPQTQTYMEQQMEEDVPDGPGTGEGFSFRKTGKTTEICGYRSDQFHITADGEQIELWATRALGKMVQLKAVQGNARGGMEVIERELGEKGYIPLRIIQTRDGEEEMRMEAVAVEKKTLPADLFTIPKGYTKMELPFRR
ncbi:MAG: DUF4412 domain-containing protein [Bacteroidota bacterium]